jgi:NTP pyrophosphatase (non-canonical NTP hydrolase)
MKETQQTIGEWALETFPGEPTLASRHCLRLLEEVVELCREAGAYPACIVQVVHAALSDVRKARQREGFTELSRPERVPNELADCAIMLDTLAYRAGVDLRAEVDHKMEINRARQWADRGDGTGYHIPYESDTAGGEA